MTDEEVCPRWGGRGGERAGGTCEETAAPGPGQLSARERELVTLVAQGRTNAQIAAQLSISVRTVRSRLDRIRAKTGSQRRADLTRLALQANLVLSTTHGACARTHPARDRRIPASQLNTCGQREPRPHNRDTVLVTPEAVSLRL